MIRIALAAAICFAPVTAHAYPCWMVKAAYAPFKKHGLAAAEKWARGHGYSEEEISKARRCIK